LAAAEDNLVQQAQQGSRQAYADLIRKYYGSVYMVCLGYLGNPTDAEDTAQEVFLKGYMKIRTLRRPEQFEGWIRRIAKNESRNFLRRRRKETSLFAFPAEIFAAKDCLETSYEELQSAIAGMPADLRVPLLMYYFDGRKADHVAQALGVSRISIYRRLKEAVGLLGEVLRKGREG